MKKTLYGLGRSPFHWYQRIRSILLSISLTQSIHDPCVFYGSLEPNQPPLYVCLYVDDFKYWSTSDAVEQLFDQKLGARCKVDFMGEVSWFLGCKYEWETLPDGNLTVSITQTARAEEMIEDHGLSDCNPVRSPYKSGAHIDRVPDDGIALDDKIPLVKKYQSLVGGLLWLQRQTRPDLTACVSLLSQYSHKPSDGHYQCAKQVLKYLKGSIDRGIRFTQGGPSLHVESYFPTQDGVYTDANWGPQDASHPHDGETVTIEETQSLLGHVVYRMGGPLMWACMREPTTVSRSSCESEIYATDEGTKSGLTIRHLSAELKLPEAFRPTPVWNDNRGTVDWAKGCSVSKKLRHVNIRENAVRLSQQLGEISVSHIEGKSNIADLFTKEHKDVLHFEQMAKTITSPRLVQNISSNSFSPLSEGAPS